VIAIPPPLFPAQSASIAVKTVDIRPVKIKGSGK
jgi:hypothetical protein